MKARILILGLLVSFSTALMAQTSFEKSTPIVNVQLTATNDIVLRCVDADNQKIQVQVFNENGKRLFSKKYKGSAHMKFTVDTHRYKKGDLVFKVLCNNELINAEKVTKQANGLLSMPVQLSSGSIKELEKNAGLLTRSSEAH